MKLFKFSVRIIGKTPPPIGGVTITTIRLFKRLKKDANIDVYLTSINKNNDKDKKIEYVHNYLMWLINRLFFGFKEDIIHYQGASLVGLFFIVLVKLLHPFKLIWSIHSEYTIPKIEESHFLSFKLWLLKKCNLITVDNNNIKKQLEKYLIPSTVIFPFLMPKQTNIVEKDFLAEYKNKNVVVFNAYKLVFNKDKVDVYGLDVLIKAIREIEKKLDNNYILLIPSFCEADKLYLDKLILDAEIKNTKSIIVISDLEIAGWEYIACSDVFIRPTVTDGDALSLRESLYLGVPAVASDCVGRPINTILFKNENSLDLAEKIIFAIQNKKELSQKLKDNKSDALKNFINLYTDIYNTQI